MATSTSATRSVSKSNIVEDCEHILTLLRDKGIGDPIDVVTMNCCAKGVTKKFLKYACEFLKSASAKNDNDTHKLEE